MDAASVGEHELVLKDSCRLETNAGNLLMLCLAPCSIGAGKLTCRLAFRPYPCLTRRFFSHLMSGGSQVRAPCSPNASDHSSSAWRRPLAADTWKRLPRVDSTPRTPGSASPRLRLMPRLSHPCGHAPLRRPACWRGE
ncbi:hypothetical protein F751_5750 [Auxenochlorella protothecoides]|uniref:Uncharacterized protein n=1 Tax=Auxenochlorella protothecoides TaxID=3075 RepID=A0A087SUA8_AUXPR|nr:hypothetical protein F751_5750 [Auxenochlorella protothecoides]KFM29312.1 hypothetical protein F751_5750 [Auxenochlorella protothecoides]